MSPDRWVILGLCAVIVIGIGVWAVAGWLERREIRARAARWARSEANVTDLTDAIRRRKPTGPQELTPENVESAGERTWEDPWPPPDSPDS
jgi:hypothetical protein